MIQVTRLDHSPVVINALMIVTIEQSHDTVISLVNSDKMVVREGADEIVGKVVSYLRQIHGAPITVSYTGAQGA